jgi:hypothetical protein
VGDGAGPDRRGGAGVGRSPLTGGNAAARPCDSGDDRRVTTTRDPQPTLAGRRVRLRPWRPDDAGAVFAACQDEEIQRWTEVPVPYLREHADGSSASSPPPPVPREERSSRSRRWTAAS